MALLRRIVQDQRHLISLGETDYFSGLTSKKVLDVVHEIFSDRIYHMGRYMVAVEFILQACNKFPTDKEEILSDCENYLREFPHSYFMFQLEVNTYGLTSLLLHRILHGF